MSRFSLDKIENWIENKFNQDNFLKDVIFQKKENEVDNTVSEWSDFFELQKEAIKSASEHMLTCIEEDYADGEIKEETFKEDCKKSLEKNYPFVYRTVMGSVFENELLLKPDYSKIYTFIRNIDRNAVEKQMQEMCLKLEKFQESINEILQNETIILAFSEWISEQTNEETSKIRSELRMYKEFMGEDFQNEILKRMVEASKWTNPNQMNLIEPN